MIAVAVVAASYIFVGACKEEPSSSEQPHCSADKLRPPRHDPREDSLKTLEDSVHFYEDGF